MKHSSPNLSDKLLANLQANILKGHGRDFAQHLFFRFDDKKKIKQSPGYKILPSNR